MPWPKTGATHYHAAQLGLLAPPLDILGCWTMAFECHGQHLRPYEVIDEVTTGLKF